MGNAAYRQTTTNPNMDQDLKTFMQSDLPRFVWQERIGNGKFMKSYLMRVESTQLVVKVYMKLSDEDLQSAATKLTSLWKTLSPTKFPSLMPYQMWIRSTARIKTPNIPVYLIRQYFHYNLFDRLSTRPFLNELEKYWIIFQLLKCLEICHEHKIVHGDIKPENIMCTTSNWVVLTDFAPFKPSYIPDDDPTDFQFYFDSMARHKCYIAPERFSRQDLKGQAARNINSKSRNKSMSSALEPGAGLTPSMDVFSVGCVIAEVLLDGTPFLDFPSMLQYLSSPVEGLGTTISAKVQNPGSRDDEEVNPAPSLKSEIDESPAKQLLLRIKNPLMRAVIIDMTQKDPEKRLSASEYLKVLSGNVEQFSESYAANFFDFRSQRFHAFPTYFESCLYPLYLKLHWNGVTPDGRIAIICQSYDTIMEKITGESDEAGTSFFKQAVENSTRLLSYALSMDTKNQGQLLPGIPQQLSSSEEKKNIYEKLDKDLLSRSREGGMGTLMQEVLRDSNSSNAQRMNKIPTDSVENALAAATNFLKEVEGTAETKQDSSTELDSDNFIEMFKTSNSMGFFHVNKPLGHKRPCFEGLVLIVDLLCSNYRHLKFMTSRVTCIMMLGRIGRLCADSVILKRIIPLLLVALEDSFALIKVTALRTLTALCSLVEEFEPIEVNFFPQYLFPNISRVCRDPEPIVRIAFAECMGVLALTAKSFLDRGHSIFLNKAISTAIANNLDINKVTVEFPYDQKLELLKDQVARWIRDLAVEGNVIATKTKNSFASESAVKKVLLQHIMELCVFFGQESTMEKLLTHVLTFPNDQDWELRYSFCMRIPTVAAFLGTTVTSEFIVPCLENTIYDVEEKVSLSTIVAITSLIEMKLIAKYWIIDFIQKCKALLIHPSKAIRSATIQLFVTSSNVIGECSTAVFLLPEIKDVLKYDLLPQSLNVENLSRAIVPPLSRETIRYALWSKLKEQSMQPGSNININELLYSAVNPIPDGNTLDDPSEDDHRTKFASNYIHSSAKEIFNKSLRWRSITRGYSSSEFPSLRKNTSGYLSPSPNISGKYDSNSNNNLNNSASMKIIDGNGLLWTYLPNLENSVFCFQIPQMKAATYIPESMRKQNIFLDIDELTNQQKIKYFFMGAMSRESALVLNSIEQFDEMNNLTVGSPMGKNNNNNANQFDYSQNNSSYRNAAATRVNSIALLRRLKSLNIPPLPVDMGALLPLTDDRIPEPSDSSPLPEGGQKVSWKPKEGVLLMTLREHKNSVNRLVVAPDQSYFASASSDRTIRIWQTKQLDRLSFPKSCAVYDRHHGPVIDAAIIDNSHSVASASKDGSVHIWRVEMQPTVKPTIDSNANEGQPIMTRGNVSVSGTSLIRTLNANEGEIVSVHHFTSDVASIVTYATQKGGVHGWDLRMPQEVFKYSVRPELGYITSMSIGPDKNWICLGTSRGYLSLWDVRYNLVSQVWKHSSNSPIHRLASCKAIRSNNQNFSGIPSTEGAYLFVAAGENETAVFGLPEAGECLKCFRSLSLDDNKAPIAPLPYLESISIPRHPYAPLPSSLIHGGLSEPIVQNWNYPVKAMIGRVSPTNLSYLITAGSDRHIRYWDFRSAEACYTVAGLEATQMKSIYRKLDDKQSAGKLFVCYTPTIPAADKILQSHLPMREGRGLTAPSNNFKDAVMDLKDIDYPMKFLLASSRDGEIKIWR